jgi:hypothetical protein
MVIRPLATTSDTRSMDGALGPSRGGLATVHLCWRGQVLHPVGVVYAVIFLCCGEAQHRHKLAAATMNWADKWHLVPSASRRSGAA